MKKISISNFVTLDGFFAGPHGELDWFKVIASDPEYDKYTHTQSKSGGTLLFGHTTYEMMKSYWPTPEAEKGDPKMAKVMNNSRKVVVSKTLKTADEGPIWKNIQILHELDPREIVGLKEREDLVILGSGSIVQQLANLGLIDEFQVLVVPVVLGAGKPLFRDVGKLELELVESRAFKNGILSLRYQPKK